MLSTPIGVDTVRRLAEFERVVGINYASGDVGQMCRLIRGIRPDRPDFTFMTGWEAVLVPMLLAGADGGTNATRGGVPEVTRRMFDLCQEGTTGNAMDIQYRLGSVPDNVDRWRVEFPVSPPIEQAAGGSTVGKSGSGAWADFRMTVVSSCQHGTWI